MLSRAVAKRNQEFRVVLLSDGRVTSERSIRSEREADAFLLAEQMTSAAAKQGARCVSAYVLDDEHVFRGSVGEEALSPIAA